MSVVMRNREVILINGMARSGSNILWNIMQSHPQVCSPISETNGLLHPRGRGLHKLSRLLYIHCDAAVLERYIDCRLFNAKLENLNHPSNKYKRESEPYEYEELKDTVLCLKALNDDVYLTDRFYSMYDEIHAIGLVRNGYSVCEGRVRRGERAVEVGKAYARYMGRIIEDSKRLRNYRLVKFESLLDRPFEVAQSLYAFCGLKPDSLDKLRLKSKRTLSADGSHSKEYKRVGDKYWLDRSEIAGFLDPKVDSIQADQLSALDRRLFEEQAKPVLEYLGYA